MKKITKIMSCLIVLFFLLGSLGYAGELSKYTIKKEHKGGDVTPVQAYQMLQKDAKHTFLVDVRTKAEYQIIGHPVGAYLVPLKFWTGKLGKKKYGRTNNKNFAADLKKRFNSQTDTLLFICRSGGRTCDAATLAVEAGWPENKVYNVMGGFEGDKSSVDGSMYKGMRIGGGWKNEGLPWTYNVDVSKAY